MTPALEEMFRRDLADTLALLRRFDREAWGHLFGRGVVVPDVGRIEAYSSVDDLADAASPQPRRSRAWRMEALGWLWERRLARERLSAWLDAR